MLIRLPFLFLGALGLPMLVLMSLAFTIAELRNGEPVNPMFPVLALVGLVMMLWLYDARKLALSDPRPTFLARVARVVPWLMIPGIVFGIVLGIYAYDRVVTKYEDKHAGNIVRSR